MSQVWVECTCTLPAPCDFPSGISVFAVSLSFFSLPLFINFCFWLHWVSWAETSHCSSRASCFYAWTFSSCGEWGLLSSCGARASHCSGFSCGGVQALGHVGFSDCGIRAQLPQGMWDLSSWTRDRTCVPCIGRQTPNHWTTRETPVCMLH